MSASAQDAVAADDQWPGLSGAESNNEAATGVPASALGAATDSGRESAQALSCNTSAYANPQVVAYDMTRDRSTARQDLLAQFDLAIINSNYSSGSAAVRSFVSGLKSRNRNIKVAHYSSFAELKPSAPATDAEYAVAREVSSRSWWLNDRSGNLVTWTGGTTRGVNISGWTTANSSGQRYPQYRARFDHAAYGDTGIDYYFTANVFAQPRVDADWRRNGSNQSRNDAAVQSAYRSGYVGYWSTLRSLNSGIKVIAALDKSATLTSSEFRSQLDAAYLDGLTGQTWSYETKDGWASMMNYYRTVQSGVKSGGAVIFSSYGASPTDYAAVRYGLASSLLSNNSYYSYRPRSGSTVPVWYDEYSAPLGGAVDGPQTAPRSNGVFLRRFENGVVLVNPQSASATIDVGSGYRRLAGSQDPSVNNGQVQTQVTLPARSGLILVRSASNCTGGSPAPSPAPAPAPTPAPSPAPAPAPTPAPSPAPAPAPTPAPAAAPTVDAFAAANGYARPRIAALDYSRNTTDARRAMLAKYNFLIFSLTKSMGATAMRNYTDDIKKRNPNIRMAHYVLPTEVLCSVASNHDHYDTWQATQRADWWLYRANGTRSQWTTQYNACDINITRWAKKDSNGRSWAQWKWQRDYDTFFKNMPAVDYVHFDNVMRVPRVDADWKRNGSNQLRTDAAIQAEFRAGMAENWKAVRAAHPGYKVSGNADSDMSFAEYKGQLDFAFLEGVIGKSWSRERDWNTGLNYYRGAMENTKTRGNVIVQAFTAGNDYKTARYGLAMTMLDDGYYLQTNYPSAQQEPSWFDEYDAPIGKAIESPPKAAASGSIWMRKYENGLVLVNSSKTASATINIGSGYRRLSGKQEPSVNHGRSESVVTLPARSGLLMLKN